MAAEIPTYDEAWLKLLHYHKTLGGYRGLVENQDFYISPDGRDNPIAEFAAEIKAFADGTEKCRFPARFNYLKQLGKVQGDFLLIEISNSYSGRGSIRSGTGLANIKAVAEKYHGAMEIRTDGAIFTLSVLLIIPQQSESISQQVC